MDIQTLWGQFLLNNAAVQNISPANITAVPNLGVINNVNLDFLISNNDDDSNDGNEKDENDQQENSSSSDENNCEDEDENGKNDTGRDLVTDDQSENGMETGDVIIRTDDGDNDKTDEQGTQKTKIVRTRYSEEYRCETCPYTCFTERALLKHTLHCDNSEEGLKKLRLSCPVCGKDRQDDIALSVHMERHRQNKYFCCDMCKFKSIQLKKIILHRRMHTGEKPHLCPYCTYRSSRKDNLRNHTRRVHKKDLNDCDTFIPRKIVIRPKSK